MKSYVVLARKYRPQVLKDLIGQDIVCEILTKAFENNRIPHAFLLHGIRGVGKTTIARILAKGLNCLSGPTTNPCEICNSCQKFQEDRHMDIVEMDAASRTGVDDIRDIIDSSKYKPIQGKYKVFIIDEVHMLSKSAFNALLKTLEEPPPHVVFIFATTEIRKIPDTVLSRCIRLDLKRLDSSVQMDYIKKILEKEKVSCETDAIISIVRASEGSMRDSLSLLDQAISLAYTKGKNEISESLIRSMLGLVDRSKILSLLFSLFKGDVTSILENVRICFSQGGSPSLIIYDLLDLVYLLICLKNAPNLDDQSFAYSNEDCKKLCNNLGTDVFLRAWQILFKGYEEINISPLPMQTLEMVLIRFCYISGEFSSEPKKKVEQSNIQSFKDVLSLMQKHEPYLSSKIQNLIQIHEFSLGRIVFSILDETKLSLVNDFKKSLEKYTNQKWTFERTLQDQIVSDIFKYFPNTKIIN